MVLASRPACAHCDYRYEAPATQRRISQDRVLVRFGGLVQVKQAQDEGRTSQITGNVQTDYQNDPQGKYD